MLSRRELLKAAALTSAHVVLSPALSFAEDAPTLAKRPAPADRKFSSSVIEAAIERV